MNESVTLSPNGTVPSETTAIPSTPTFSGYVTTGSYIPAKTKAQLVLELFKDGKLTFEEAISLLNAY